MHHLLTVDGVTPNCSESQRDVRFFSNKTIFIRLISSILIALFHKDSDLLSIYLLNCEIIPFSGHFLGIFMYFLAKNGQTQTLIILFLFASTYYLSSQNLLSFIFEPSPSLPSCYCLACIFLSSWMKRDSDLQAQYSLRVPPRH